MAAEATDPETERRGASGGAAASASVACWRLRATDRRLVVTGAPPGPPHAAALELDAWAADVHPEDRSALLDWFADPAEPERDFRMIGADGRTVWLRAVEAAAETTAEATVERGDRRGVLIDVTELKASQRALNNALKRQEDFAAVASEWHWEMGPDLRFTFHTMPVDATAAPVDTRIGKTLREMLGAAAAAEPFRTHLTRLEARLPFRGFEYEAPRSDGLRQVISVNGEPFYDEAGAFAGYRGVCRDVTEARETEEALRASKEAAERASKAKSDFLAQMSHELRTPLNAIIGFAEIMSNELAGPLPPRYRGYAEDIRRSGEHLLTLICDILDLSKIEAGKHELNVEELDAAEILEGCLRMMRERAVEAGLSLELSLQPAAPRLQADRRALKQIVLNLLSNAVKFTEAGGVVALQAGACGATGGFLIAIRDDGVGMTPAELADAFEPFTQVGESLELRNAGTGLGLSLVRSLVRLHGGEIDMKSALGQGTTVTVRLPAAGIAVDETTRDKPTGVAAAG